MLKAFTFVCSKEVEILLKKWVDVYQNPKANPRCVASGLVHDKRINVPEILARYLICTAFKGLAWELEDCALDLNCSSDGVPGICWSHSCYYWGHFGPYLRHLLQLFLHFCRMLTGHLHKCDAGAGCEMESIVCHLRLFPRQQLLKCTYGMSICVNINVLSF